MSGRCNLTCMVPMVLMLLSIFTSACTSEVDQGQFELELHSSVFGEISVVQGKSATATVAINRNTENLSDSPDINMTLIDPPSWLQYTFDQNPASGNNSTMKLNIDENATPGIYRLILHGERNMPGQVYDDSVTFHLVVETANTA